MNIIIVEDRVQVANQLAVIIKETNLPLEVAGVFYDGESAKEFIDNFDNNVDCVLCDIELPFFSGLELSKYIYENHPHIKVSLISAYKKFEYAQEAMHYSVVNYITKPFVYENLISSLKELIQKASENQRPEKEMKKAENDIIIKAVEYIDSNFKQKITLTDISSYSALNPQYFSRLFKKHTGMTFVDYLSKKRINYAKELLVNSDMKISLIAIKSGYPDSNYFHKIFKNTVGISPVEYRNQKGNIQ